MLTASECERLVEMRHHLHRHPELSCVEERTAAFVADRLRELGLPVATGIGGHGLVATVGREGPAIAIIPLLSLASPKLEKSQRAVFAPFQYAAKNPLLLSKLILPMLLTSLGAGLIMPFMNVFFRVVHNQPDTVIGTLFAWGSLAMGVGLLIAPPLAEAWGAQRPLP